MAIRATLLNDAAAQPDAKRVHPDARLRAMTRASVDADDIRAARALLDDVIVATPLLHSRYLSGQVGGPVYLKCENLQRAGSFKVRGAYVRIARLSEAERAGGVVAASAGNHAQGVALAAGIAAAIKDSRPDVKVMGVQAKRAAAFPPSLATGHPVRVDVGPTMADGIAVGRPGDLTFAMVAELVDAVVTVSEESLAQGLLACLERSKQGVEPAGAAGVAAMLEH